MQKSFSNYKIKITPKDERVRYFFSDRRAEFFVLWMKGNKNSFDLTASHLMIHGPPTNHPSLTTLYLPTLMTFWTEFQPPVIMS